MKQALFILLFLLSLIAIEKIYCESPFRSDYIISSPYHSTTGKGGERRNNIHEGIDLYPVDDDWIIFPVLSGIIRTVRISPIYGKYIIIEHDNGLYTKYAHGTTIYDKHKEGDYVSTNDYIMLMGSTGYSDGAHVHIEAYKIVNGEKVNENPLKYINRSLYEKITYMETMYQIKGLVDYN